MDGKRQFQVLVIPYCWIDEAVKYAIFQRADCQIWQWIAGGGEIGETPICAAKREAWEEAGIPFESRYTELQAKAFIPAEFFSDLADSNANSLVEYSFGVEVDQDVIRISGEHVRFNWLGYSEAVDLLNWDSNKNALRELNMTLHAQRFR